MRCLDKDPLRRPQSAQDVLSGLKQRMGDGMLAMSFQELLSKLDAQSMLTKDKTHALARALESFDSSVELRLAG